MSLKFSAKEGVRAFVGGRPLFLLLIFVFLPALALGADGRALAQKAAEAGLGNSGGWLALLHYPKTSGESQSAVDDPKFFLSPNGKRDPAAELWATIEALLADNSSKTEKENPLCRFPARKRFVKESLGLSDGDFPAASCPDYDTYIGKVSPHSASIIFATAHMNSPGSMFGHTLLLIDPDMQSKILGYAVNYAAEVDQSDDPFSYAAKGLLGIYPGKFSLLPYWEKIAEYGAMEQRDVWEYRLNLTEEEAFRMAEHTWELREMYSDYFFLDENCSYNILFLLEVARPGVSLTGGYGGWVIPLDTLKDVIDQNLVADSSFRPSPARKIESAARVLSPEAIRMAKELSEPQADTSAISKYDLPPEQKALALEVAADFTQRDYLNHKIELGAYKKKLFELTTQRSRLGRVEEKREADPIPMAPQLAHDSARVKIGWGNEGGEGFGEISLRSAYHDLSDPSAGFPEGAQIQFPWITGRYRAREREAKIQEIGVLDILSISAIGEFFTPISWRVKTGAARRLVAGSGSELAPYFEGGGGAALGFSRERGLLWVMTEGRLYREGDGGFRAGFGGEVGFLFNESPSLKTVALARGLYYPDFKENPDLELGAVQSLTLSRNLGASLSFLRKGQVGLFSNETLFSLSYFF